VCAYHCVQLSYTTQQKSSDDFPSYPPDNHHSLDDVYWRGEGPKSLQRQYLARTTSTSFCSLVSCQANSSTDVANCDRLMLTTTMTRMTVSTTTTILWLQLHDDDFMTTTPWLQLYDYDSIITTAMMIITMMMTTTNNYNNHFSYLFD